MDKYIRYVVVGSKKLTEHAYSSLLGSEKALSFATDCADHHSMNGRVFGESINGDREIVYVSKGYQQDNS